MLQNHEKVVFSPETRLECSLKDPKQISDQLRRTEQAEQNFTRPNCLRWKLQIHTADIEYLNRLPALH